MRVRVCVCPSARAFFHPHAVRLRELWEVILKKAVAHALAYVQTDKWDREL